METATASTVPVSTAPVFEIVAVIPNVKVAIPSRGSKWRVGVWNKTTGQNTPLGFEEKGVIAGLSRKQNAEEDVCFTLGLIVKTKDGQVIVNRSYHGLSAVDFGKNLSCTVEINCKTVGEGKNAKKYTSVSIIPTGGPYKKELKFNSANIQPGSENFPIEGTDALINVIPLQ